MKAKQLLLIFLFCVPVINSFSAVIELLPEAKVSGAVVELGEIARISADSPKQSRELSKMELCKLPEEKVTIKADEIRAFLLRKYRGDFVLIGEQISLEPLFTSILEYEIVEKVKSAALVVYPKLTYDSLRVILLDPLPPIKVPQADIKVRVIVPGGPFHLTKLARVEIHADDRLVVSQTAKVKLMAHLPVALAVRTLSKNQLLKKSDYKICYRMINLEPEQYFVGEGQKTPLVLRSSIAKGTPILLGHLALN